MEKYTYNFEIRTNILHFMAAIDGAVVKRYDKDRNPQQEIKVNYVYAPKSAILKDLVDKANHIKLPIAAVSLKSLKRAPERVKNKLDGYYKQKHISDPRYEKVRSPVPVDLTFDLHILAKYQADAEQMINNWAAYFDPYIVVSWKEPYTGYELRSKIIWDGSANLTYPEQQSVTDLYRIEVQGGFTFEGWLFKDLQDIEQICCIETSLEVLSSNFCFWDTPIEWGGSKDILNIQGLPEIKNVYPLKIITNEKSDVNILGNFLNTKAVLVSGNNPEMFPLSSFDYFPDNENFPWFDGYPVDKFVSFPNYLNITVEPSAIGNMNIVVVNDCGYSILTEDMTGNQNPYDSDTVWYSEWNDVANDGVFVIETYPLTVDIISCE